MEKKEDTWVEPQENPASFEKVKDFLTKGGAKFDVTEHKPVLTSEEAAEVRGVSLESGAKAIILKDTGKKLVMEGVPFYLAVLSAAKKFNSK